MWIGEDRHMMITIGGWCAGGRMPRRRTHLQDAALRPCSTPNIATPVILLHGHPPRLYAAVR